jgi:hypothetical protein
MALVKAMNLDPEERYQSGREMREALRQIKQAIEAEIAERGWQGAERRQHSEKEEDLLKLEQALTQNVVMQPVVTQPSEADTEQIVTQPGETDTEPIATRSNESNTESIITQTVSDERRIDQEKTVREAAATSESEQQRRAEEESLGQEEKRFRKTQSLSSKRLLISGSTLAVVIVIAYLVWQHPMLKQKPPITPSPSPLVESSPNQPSAEPIEFLRYSLEARDQKTRITTLDKAPDKPFKVHFTPRESGYLYLLSPRKEGENPRFLIFAQSIMANKEFSYPEDDKWLPPDPKAKRITITIVFSTQLPSQLEELSKAAGAKRMLTDKEKKDFQNFRDQDAQSESKKPHSSGSNSAVSVLAIKNGKPLVFEIVLQNKRGGG